MFNLKAICRTAAISFVMASLSISIFADTIRLKDGSIIKGRITSFDGGRFTIEIGDGARKRQLNFDAAEVESIEFETVARPAISTNVRQPDETRYEPVAKPQPARTDVPSGPLNQPKTPARSDDRSEITAAASSSAKPVELSIKVLADHTANGWTNSGWVVKKGQRIRISGTGEISLGKGKNSEPGGLWDLEDANKLLAAVPTGALIAVIGDDNNEFLYIGNDREFVAARDGSLFLGVNEGDLKDNKGSYNVKIEIFPGG